MKDSDEDFEREWKDSIENYLKSIDEWLKIIAEKLDKR